MNISLSISTVSSVSDYTFAIEKADYADLPASSTLAVTFPSQYITVLTAGSYTCEVISWPISGVTLSCSITGLILTVSNGFPVMHLDNGVEVYSFLLKAVNNPQYARYTDVFDGQFYSNGATVFTMQSNSGSGVLITQGIMSK